MDALLNAFLAIGLLVVIILIVYLVDRVNSIERETRRVAQSVSTPVAPVKQGPFGDLEGKRLWDALSGRAPDGMDEPTLQDMRERYELVLHKHIQSVFEEGVKDGQRGLSGEPRNPRSIKTAKGAVEAWMPGSQINSLYKCGMDSVQQGPDALDSVRLALDETGQFLFAKVQIPLKEPLSASLLPSQAPVDPLAPALAGPGAANPPEAGA